MKLPSIKIAIRISANPVRDWLALCGFTAVLLAGILVLHLWLFEKVARGGVLGNSEGASEAVISPQVLAQIQAVFEARKIEEDSYSTGTHTFTDPSR